MIEQNPLATAAALCLYDQPFGFTQADVSRLHLIAQFITNVGIDPRSDEAQVFLDSQPEWMRDTWQLASWALDVADRIAALLPPPPE